jgi:hypothetical protein
MRSQPDRGLGYWLVLALWAFGILAIALFFYKAWLSPLSERDFVAMWAAGKLAASGHVLQAYDPAALRAAALQIVGATSVKLSYPYPPHALFIAVPLSMLPLAVAFWTWQLISAGLFYVAARPYLPARFPTILAVLTPAALINILFGQVGLFFGALWLFAFSGSRIASALITFKPHLAALVGVEVIKTRRILVTAAILIAVLLASVLVFGLNAWPAWLFGSAAPQLVAMTGRYEGSWSLQMVAPYFGYGLVGWLVFAVAAIALLIRSFNVFTAATASFLIAPYGLHYDLTVVCLGFGLLLSLRLRELPAWQAFVCAVVFLLPLLVVLGTRIAPPLLLLGLYVQTLYPIPERNQTSAP